MDKRAGQPMTRREVTDHVSGVGTSQLAPLVPSGEGGDEATALRMDIERTRQDMSRTVNAIEERLSPAHIKEQIADVKESFVAQYHDAKEHIKEDIVNEVREAKDKVKEELREAKDSIKEEIHEASHAVHEQFEHAKTAVHDATVGRVKHMVVDARETMSDAGSSMISTIRANPIPAAMVAVGLGWLAMSLARGGSRRSERRYELDAGYDYDGIGGYEPPRTRRMITEGRRAVGDAVHNVGERVANAGHRVGETASNLGHRVGETANGMLESVEGAAHNASARIGELGSRATEGAAHLAHDARERATHLAAGARDTGLRVARGAERQYHRAEETIEHSYEANPLAFGAVSLALGAAIGLALPHTQREDQWMGEHKDRLIRGAEGLAHEALHKVQEQASELASSGMGGESRQIPGRSEYA